MLPYTNYMFISRNRFNHIRSEAFFMMDFVFIQEEDGAFTVYKNRRDGSQLKGLTRVECLELVDGPDPDDES